MSENNYMVKPSNAMIPPPPKAPEERMKAMLSAREKEPEIKRTVVEVRKRIDRYGYIVNDRKVLSGPLMLKYPFEPEWNLTPTPLQGLFKEYRMLSRSSSKGGFLPYLTLLKGTDVSQELMLKPIQEQLFGNIYAFSDSEETLDDLDKRYKSLGLGLKNYMRQKKKFNGGKGTMTPAEA